MSQSRRFGVSLAIVATVSLIATPAVVLGAVFSNNDGIVIQGEGSLPYPSTIAVSGVVGTITDLNVTFSGLSHTFPDDIDALLVGPTGVNTMLMSDAGGAFDASNVSLTFDDEAASGLPDSGGGLSSGSFKPTNWGADADGFSSPAPVPAALVSLAVFDGTDANGTWSLFIEDDTAAESGNISGWSLAVTVAQADLAIDKSDLVDPVTVGSNVTYTVDVSNGGPDTATNVVVTDPLPAGVTYVSATPTQGTCSELSGTVTCELGDLANGAGASVDIVVSTSSVGLLSNTATVSSDIADPVDTNDSDTEETTVDEVAADEADLAIDKSDLVDPVTVGSNVTYTVDVSNGGPDTATNVVVTDPLPAGVTYVSATPTQGTCSELSGTVTCELGDLANGAGASVDIVVSTSSVGLLSNTATVSSDIADPVDTNDSDTEETTVDEVPPANDDFPGQELVGASVSVTGTNVDATKQPGEPDHADDTGGHSVWYSWTAPSDGTVNVNTCDSDFDTLLAVYTGDAVDALSLIESNDDADDDFCDYQSELSFAAIQGTIYRIAVDGWDGDEGIIGLRLRAPVLLSDAGGVFWANYEIDSISLANFDGSGGGDLVTSGATVDAPQGVAIDAAAGKIWWANCAGPISYANLDGTGGGGDLDTSGATVDCPQGLAIDPAGEKIWWTNSGDYVTCGGSISFAALDGSGGGDLDTSGATVDCPTGLAIDPAGGKIWWTNTGELSDCSGSISFAALDGSGGGDLDTSGATVDCPTGLAIDLAAEKIWWTNYDDDSISSADLGGGGGADLDTGGGATVDGPWGLAIDAAAGRIWWTNYDDDSISFANVNGSGGNDLDTGTTIVDGPNFPVLLKKPVGDGDPAITGGSTPGSELSCSQGDWAPDLLESFLYRVPESFAYQWSLDGSDIGGATSDTYTATAEGDYRCIVTATNAAGSTSQTSDPVTVTGGTTEATTTALASSANPSVYGQPVTFTATVTGSTPTGTVQFKVGGVNRGVPVALNGSGQASIVISNLPRGTSTVRAFYLGDTGFDPSTSPKRFQTVHKAATAVAVNGNHNPAARRTLITFTASVSPVAPGGGTPHGWVRFRIDGSKVGRLKKLASGVATITVRFNRTVGDHNVTARYKGSKNYLVSTSPAYVQTITSP